MAFQAPPAPRPSGHVSFVCPARCRGIHAATFFVVLTILLTAWLTGAQTALAADGSVDTGQAGKSQNGSTAPEV